MTTWLREVWSRVPRPETGRLDPAPLTMGGGMFDGLQDLGRWDELAAAVAQEGQARVVIAGLPMSGKRMLLNRLRGWDLASMWRVTPAGPPIFVVTGVTPEPPAALDPATLSVSMLPLRSCGCDAADSWCCMGSVDEHSLEFTVDGEAPVVVDPGFVNFENLSYAGAKYEVVVTEAHEAAACGFGLSTGWYMRRL